MAHTCPECGLLCYCGGDIDDCQMDGTEDQLRCSHCDDEDKERDDDPSEDEDNRQFSEPIPTKQMSTTTAKPISNEVLVFSNFNVACFDLSDQQIPELQENLLVLWAKRAERHGYDPANAIIKTHEGNWRILRTPDGWNIEPTP